MKSSYNQTVELSCPICAGKYFDTVNDRVTCSNCKNSFTRQQLQDANKRTLNASFESLKKEVFTDVKKDFQKSLEKTFGSNFKIK